MQFNFAIVWSRQSRQKCVTPPPNLHTVQSFSLCRSLSCDSCCAYISLYSHSFSTLSPKPTNTLAATGGSVRYRTRAPPRASLFSLTDNSIAVADVAWCMRGACTLFCRRWYAKLCKRRTRLATPIRNAGAIAGANVRAVWTPERCKQNL